jgi:hypothetical protein
LGALTQYNLAAIEFGSGTGTPEQNRRIGRNTLLLQMINPGVGGEIAEILDLVAGRERSCGERG